MFKFILKYKPFNWETPISILSEDGSKQYELRPTIPRKWQLLPKQKFELVKSKQGTSVITMVSGKTFEGTSLRYILTKDGESIGELSGKKPFVHSEFKMEFNKEKYRLYGSKRFLYFWETEFKITKDNHVIAGVEKRWYSRWTYNIYIQDEKEIIPILCLVVMLAYLLFIRIGDGQG